MESRLPGNAARLILIGMLVFIVLSGTSPAVMPLSAARAAESAEEAAFGPQLFLLGPCPLLAEIPPNVPATLHAALYGEEPTRYIASAGPDLPDWAAARNIPAKLLDADTAGKAYYFADAQADGARKRSAGSARSSMPTSDNSWWRRLTKTSSRYSMPCRARGSACRSSAPTLSWLSPSRPPRRFCR